MNKKKAIFQVSPTYSPYRLSDRDSVTDWYERYKHDPAGSIECNGRVFYRVISRAILTTEKGEFLLCNLDLRAIRRIGQFLVDENGHRFKLLCRVTATFGGFGIPEWYYKAPEFELEGDVNELGEYLASEELDKMPLEFT